MGVNDGVSILINCQVTGNWECLWRYFFDLIFIGSGTLVIATIFVVLTYMCSGLFQPFIVSLAYATDKYCNMF